MLNPFPILFLAPLTYLLLRVVLGVLFLWFGARLVRTEFRTPKRGFFGILLMATGTSLVLGFRTQYGALASFVLSLVSLRYRSVVGLTPVSIILVAAISLTLFVTGAGPFAFDLPI